MVHEYLVIDRRHLLEVGLILGEESRERAAVFDGVRGKERGQRGQVTAFVGGNVPV